MLTYRSFRNTDPPLLVALWRSRMGQRGLFQPVSADLFEQLVFAKPYFDYQGLLLALDGDRPVGFAHAGFGPNGDETRLSTDYGVTCMVLVRPEYEASEAPAGLLQQCEEYLRRRGATVLYGGAVYPLNPFYLGLYGGSELPGVLQSDTVAMQLFAGHGYRPIDRTLVFRRDLDGFQAPIDRQQMQWRRQTTVQMSNDAPARTWWQACTVADFDLTRFEVRARGGGKAIASATFRNLDPGGGNAFVRAAGLVDIRVETSHLRQGTATFLLSEAFQSFLRQGVSVVEAQTMDRNTAARAMYKKLGFVQIDEGHVFRKEEA